MQHANVPAGAAVSSAAPTLPVFTLSSITRSAPKAARAAAKFWEALHAQTKKRPNKNAALMID